jgi:hypothetical protein
MGRGSGIRDPGSGKNLSRIKGSKGSGSWIRIRNTGTHIIKKNSDLDTEATNAAFC